MNQTSYKNQHHHQNQKQSPCKEVKEKFNGDWIKTGVDNDAIEFVENMGKCLEWVSSSQLRNIYGEIIRIKMKDYDKEKTAFLLLKPKVAYNYGRLKDKKEKNGFRTFKEEFFDLAHPLVKDEKTFKNFVNLFEAILAYHKVHGRRK